MSDDLQPDEGQGTDGTGIFDSYLEAVPEEHRDVVAGYLKDAEKNVNSRISDATTLQKQYEPFSQVEGLDKYDAQQLSQLLAWHQQIQDGDTFKSWLQEEAQAAGLTVAEEEALQEAEEDGTLSQADIQKLVEERAAEQVGPLQQRMQEWEDAQMTDTIEREIPEILSQIETDQKTQFSESEKEMILDLATSPQYENDPDWIQKGFERFQEVVAAAQHRLVDDKSNQPASPLTAGGTQAQEVPTDFKTAGQQAKERLLQQKAR